MCWMHLNSGVMRNKSVIICILLRWRMCLRKPVTEQQSNKSVKSGRFWVKPTAAVVLEHNQVWQTDSKCLQNWTFETEGVHTVSVNASGACGWTQKTIHVVSALLSLTMSFSCLLLINGRGWWSLKCALLATNNNGFICFSMWRKSLKISHKYRV